MDTKELIKRWKGNHRYTLRLIEAMPEEDFDFKAAEGVKTFKSQVSHIVGWLRTHSRFATGKEMEKLPTKSKEQIVVALDDFFEHFLAFLQSVSEEDLNEKVKVFYGTVSKSFVLATMDNHLSHHRGQMVLYLRAKGIVPPAYVGW